MFAESPPSFVSLSLPSLVTFLLKSLDKKKASGLDKIPPKLVKTASDTLSIPLSQAICNSLMNGIFPDAAKIAMVSPIDKKTDDKNKISNYRPVSVLYIFSKVYGTVLKNKLVSALSGYMSPLISAYKKSIAHNMLL